MNSSPIEEQTEFAWVAIMYPTAIPNPVCLRAAYEKVLARLDPEYAPWLAVIDDAERLTAEDYRFTVNA